MAERYLSTAAAAAHVGVTPRTLRRWIAGGRLPARRTHPSPRGGRLRILLSDLERLLTEASR